jgi:hypothetical protein
MVAAAALVRHAEPELGISVEAETLQQSTILPLPDHVRVQASISMEPILCGINPPCTDISQPLHRHSPRQPPWTLAPGAYDSSSLSHVGDPEIYLK